MSLVILIRFAWYEPEGFFETSSLMIFLAEKAAGRDNNLNLLRALAALTVLVSHAFPITLGIGAAEPLEGLVGYSLGSLSVFVFFAISGFLISASFERTSSRLSFVLARVLRLMPGLVVNLVFVALVLGPVMTRLPLTDYFSLTDPYLFILRNTLLVSLVYTLPGVATDLPFPGIVGSIWTLFFEVCCYVGVFLVGVLGAFRSRWLISVALLVYGAAWLATQHVDPSYRLDRLMELSFPFAIGVGFHVWRDRLPLSLLGVALTLIAAVLAKGTILYHPALSLAISYGTFWLAYIPGGVLRGYNRVGDYSYGIYVYAFPIQVFAVWLMGPQSPTMNMLYSLPGTLVLSMLSWHLVEGPAMACKPWLLGCFGQGRFARKSTDGGLADTENAGENLLPDLPLGSGKALPSQTPSGASAKSP